MDKDTAIRYGCCVAIGFVAGSIIFFNNGKENISYVEEKKEVVNVYKSVINTYEESSSKKESETEKIVIRNVAVPCKCPVCGSDGEKQEGGKEYVYIGQSVGDGLSLNLDGITGYMIISERIEQRDKNTEEENHKVETSTTIDKTETTKTETKEENKKINKQIDWLVGVRVGYDFMDKREKYGIDAHRRIAGPFWLGVGADIRHDLNVSADVKLSIGF